MHYLKKEITPWVTMYHWDLPQALQDKGGWTNRDVLKWFEEYAALALQNRTKQFLLLAIDS